MYTEALASADTVCAVSVFRVFLLFTEGNLKRVITPPKGSKGILKRYKGIMLTGVITERNILKNLEIVKSRESTLQIILNIAGSNLSRLPRFSRTHLWTLRQKRYHFPYPLGIPYDEFINLSKLISVTFKLWTF